MAVWTKCQFGDLPIDIVDGDRSKKYPKKNEYMKSGLPFLNSAAISDGRIDFSQSNYITQEKFESITKGRVSKGDIVLTTRGNGIGKAALYTGEKYREALINAQMLVLKPRIGEIDPDFLFSLVLSEGFQSQLWKFASGSAQPQIPIRDMRAIPVGVPDIETQRKIGTIIRTYDNLIENNNCRIDILEKMAHSIYREWFVKFRFPDHENDNFFDSPIGKIPEKWEVKRADELFNINIGKTPPRKEKEWFVSEDAGVKWLSIKDMGSANVFARATKERLADEAVSKFNVKIVPRGTVVMSFKLTVGKVVILSDDMATNEAIAHFNVKDNSLMYSEYIYLYLLNFNFQTLGNTSSIGNAINSRIVKTMPIVCPDKKVMREWVELVAPLFLRVKNLVGVVENLKKQKGAVLLKLLSDNPVSRIG